MGCHPKLLADDLSVLSKGSTALAKFVDAYDYTINYLQDMGAAIAIPKSFVFASHMLFP